LIKGKGIIIYEWAILYGCIKHLSTTKTGGKNVTSEGKLLTIAGEGWLLVR
jgi:hypothetical protein